MDDFDVLRELSMRTYLEDAFNVEKFSGEVNDSNCEFYFLYCDGKIAGYLKLNEAPSQTILAMRSHWKLKEYML